MLPAGSQEPSQEDVPRNKTMVRCCVPVIVNLDIGVCVRSVSRSRLEMVAPDGPAHHPVRSCRVVLSKLHPVCEGRHIKLVYTLCQHRVDKPPRNFVGLVVYLLTPIRGSTRKLGGHHLLSHPRLSRHLDFITISSSFVSSS